MGLRQHLKYNYYHDPSISAQNDTPYVVKPDLNALKDIFFKRIYLLALRIPS